MEVMADAIVLKHIQRHLKIPPQVLRPEQEQISTGTSADEDYFASPSPASPSDSS